MHIPDGFIDLKTAAVTGALSAAGVGASIYGIKKIFKSRVIVVMGVMAALIFALQMINFTIPGGTSGHLLGGALVSCVLGPFAGVIVLTVILVVQALIFMDGGIVALGSNIFNMAICGVLSAYLIYFLIKKISKKRWVLYIAAGIASWFSTVISAFFAALELGVSGTFSTGTVIKAMVSVHMVIGAGEALITTVIIVFIDRLRPDLIITREMNLVVKSE